MTKTIVTISIVTFLLCPSLVWSHSDHSKDENHEQHSEDKDHAADESHDHEEEHGHDAEESTNAGPEKGILEASKSAGIKLSPEAFKNFEIKTQKVSGNGPWTFPIAARLQSGEETNLYRLRNGFFKRIDFTQARQDKQQFTATSNELEDGDEVVTAGIGFLRIAEIAAFGGAPEGHSH